MVSVGVGKTFSRYTLGIMYGYEPKQDEGGLVSTLVLRNTYTLTTFNYIDFYLGLNIFHAIGSKYKTSQLHRKKGYYQEASVIALGNIGIKAKARRIKNLSLYWEGGINNLWVENYVNNPNSVNPYDHISMSLGATYAFD